MGKGIFTHAPKQALDLSDIVSELTNRLAGYSIAGVFDSLPEEASNPENANTIYFVKSE